MIACHSKMIRQPPRPLIFGNESLAEAITLRSDNKCSITPRPKLTLCQLGHRTLSAVTDLGFRSVGGMEGRARLVESTSYTKATP